MNLFTVNPQKRAPTHHWIPLAATLFTLPVWAQQAPATLTEVVVTASAIEQPIADVQAAVQVISRQQLEAYAGTSVTEALRLGAGIDARPNGSNSTVAIRGLLSNAGSPVLVLVDGLRRTGKYDIVNLKLFPVANVERIEIVRGPMSALYGSDATGGVINIITQRPNAAEGVSGQVGVTLGQLQDGQRETQVLHASLGFAAGPTQHRFAIEDRQRGLYRKPGTAQTQADQTRVDHQFVNWQMDWQLNPAHRIGLVLEQAEQDDTAPARTAGPSPQSFTGYERETRQFAAVRYAGALDTGLLNVDVSRGQTDGATTRSFPTIETTDFTQDQLDVRYTGLGDGLTWVVGAGLRQDRLQTTILADPFTLDNQHVLAQAEWRFNPEWSLLTGLRHDRADGFDGSTNPRISVMYQPGPWSFRFGYGKAYRAPSSLELGARFFRGGGRTLIVGNPNLRPETNRTMEWATTYRASTWQAEWVIFQSRVDDLIDIVSGLPRQTGDPPAVTARATYGNISRARINGSELSLQGSLSNAWSWSLGWDHLDARDGATDRRLERRTRDTFRAGLTYAQGPWQVDLRGRWLRGYFARNPGPSPAVQGPLVSSNLGLADLKVRRQMSDQWSLAVGIDNLTDARQPANYGLFGATQDPAERFFYVNSTWRF